MIPATPLPDFRSPAFLRAHIEDTLSFYLPRAIDPNGGLFHFLRDDGSVYDTHTRHLVSSTRYVVTLGMAVRRGLGGAVGLLVSRQPGHAARGGWPIAQPGGGRCDRIA